MIARPSERVERAVFAVVFIVGGGVVGHGLTVIATPDPKPVIRTITLDVPPACEEIRSAIQHERARAKDVSAAEHAAAEESAGRYDAELTKNEGTIADAADRLDTANRAEQKAALELSDAQFATDAVVDDCTPERPE